MLSRKQLVADQEQTSHVKEEEEEATSEDKQPTPVVELRRSTLLCYSGCRHHPSPWTGKKRESS